LTAIFVGAGAIYFARSWLDSERAALEALRSIGDDEPEVRFVLVAKRSLARGIFVKVEDLRWQAWPDETLDETYVVRGGPRKLEHFAGAVVRFPVVAGEPVTSARLVRPGERGFLAAALKPGMRAVTIPVSVTTGVAGFILPGDHVDMLLTHKFGGRRFATETLMPDIRVIAIDQRLNLENQGVKVSKTLTFEVTPKEVEMVTVARRLGSISLSLRSLAQPELAAEGEVKAGTGIAANDVVPEPRGRGYTWGNEISLLLNRASKNKKVTIVRGGRRQAVAAAPSPQPQVQLKAPDFADEDGDEEFESGPAEDTAPAEE
jgi:pilus assembly protein CpaB